MKTLFTILIMFLAVNFARAYETITLTENNHASIIGQVTDETIENAIHKLEKTTAPVVYLFIDSPGGSVTAGITLIEYLKTTDKFVICVAKSAISMAHQIMQNCLARFATPTNIMMQHRMSAGVNGPVQSMQGLLAVLTELEIALNKISAERIGVSLEYFFKKVTAEWWTFGEQSKELNMVDAIVNIKCDSKLYTINTKKTVFSNGFNIPIIENGCPLMTIKVDTEVKNVNKDAVKAYFKSLTYNTL